MQQMIRRFEGQMNDKSQEYEAKLKLLQKKLDDESSAHRVTKDNFNDAKSNMQIEIDKLKDENSRGKKELDKLMHHQRELE
jgi:predicted  nucleic acid-binding Zn-ribbon protein